MCYKVLQDRGSGRPVACYPNGLIRSWQSGVAPAHGAGPITFSYVPPGQPPLLREFIDIPERTSTSDFVLKLTDGVTDAEETLREYVITDRLVGNFDEALGLISSALAGGSSKAAYLHGSFGSGKSHFMAVLHALLRGEPAARRRDEFAGLLAKHDG